MAVELPPWGIRIVSRQHDRTGPIQCHQHQTPSLIVVTSGHGSCSLGDHHFPMTPDSAILIPPREDHSTSDHPGKPMNIFSVEFTNEKVGISTVSWRKLLSHRSPISLSVYAAKQIRHELRILLHEQKTQAAEFSVLMEVALTRLLIILSRHLNSMSLQYDREVDSLSKVKAVLDELEKHCYEHHDLGEASKLAHLSQRHFSNLCHEIKGMSYIKWINGVRCEKAKTLLSTTSMPIASIVFEVGFDEVSTFYRAFKKYCGQTPKDIRKGASLA